MKNWQLHFELNKQAEEVENMINTLINYLTSFKDKECKQYIVNRKLLNLYEQKHLQLLCDIASNR